MHIYLGFFYLPIKLGSDNSDLLYDEYQVRMATPRRQWNADYPGEIEIVTWNIVKQCEDDFGFSYLPIKLGSDNSDLLHDVPGPNGHAEATVECRLSWRN